MTGILTNEFDKTLKRLSAFQFVLSWWGQGAMKGNKGFVKEYIIDYELKGKLQSWDFFIRNAFGQKSVEKITGISTIEMNKPPKEV